MSDEPLTESRRDRGSGRFTVGGNRHPPAAVQRCVDAMSDLHVASNSEASAMADDPLTESLGRRILDALEDLWANADHEVLQPGTRMTLELLEDLSRRQDREAS